MSGSRSCICRPPCALARTDTCRNNARNHELDQCKSRTSYDKVRGNHDNSVICPELPSINCFCLQWFLFDAPPI